MVNDLAPPPSDNPRAQGGFVSGFESPRDVGINREFQNEAGYMKQGYAALEEPDFESQKNALLECVYQLSTTRNKSLYANLVGQLSPATKDSLEDLCMKAERVYDVLSQELYPDVLDDETVRSGGTGDAMSISPSDSPPKNDQSETSICEEDVAYGEEDAASLRALNEHLKADLIKAREEALIRKQDRESLEKELKDFKDRKRDIDSKATRHITELLITDSKRERRAARSKIQEDCLRLGNVDLLRAGTTMARVEGQEFIDLNTRQKHLLEKKELIKQQQKSLKELKENQSDMVVEDSVDIHIQEEIIETRLASIEKEEQEILKKRVSIELEKGRLARETKRIHDEDESRFNKFETLNHRYVLLNLLWKGGYSEVYKAFDLEKYRYVACKLQCCNPQWDENVKLNYIRHARRENEIHKKLVHQHIVRQWDFFQIDQNTDTNTFCTCTVLEFCSGMDLDTVLRKTPILREKEARSIILQVFQGLLYLNKIPEKIIHYDLKPGNVLLDEIGMVKLADFGLSKIVEDVDGLQGMELTSQGAGTYWYLPPECFERSKRPPLISSKVDVWSAGVLFYQMLFGKRPFGHDQTQEQILHKETITRAQIVDFPSFPSVSSEAKDLIRLCLTHNQADRPDVLTVVREPYLRQSKV